MPFHPDSRVIVEQISDKNWCLVEPLTYKGKSEVFTAPAEYVTDFASVPRITSWLIPTYGNYTPAAILHDVLLTDYLASGLVSSRDTDGLFRRILRELGVPFTRRWLMWTGVRWGAAFNGKRRDGIARDLPLMLLLSLLCLPVVLPGVVGVSLSLVLNWIIEAVTSGKAESKGIWKT